MKGQSLKSDFRLVPVNYLATRASKGRLYKSNLINSQVRRVLVLKDGERYPVQKAACFSNLAYDQGSVDQANS
ncbi:uncharacterized protein Bfra_009488 [Botrytis fragariae]|uniref:Uncharacterized protein n=1 Tax=Botrytis fragariae TaxID=1964551 RepID=A0A8H6AP57_9HELO|nr:uncharacterized protein Bfra_009488 [Botrytis fragariae]KAF5870934.1 hypothetical protein Bfra_009488 [Botrytis fragariae]